MEEWNAWDTLPWYSCDTCKGVRREVMIYKHRVSCRNKKCVKKGKQLSIRKNWTKCARPVDSVETS